MRTKILTLQFAFFLKDIIERPDIEFGDLNSSLLNIFDAMPQMIPIPRELPADVPLFILRSESNVYTCNISRSRIDFVLSRVNEDKSNTDLLKDFNAKVSGLIKYILNKQDAVRFGMVAKYFHKDNTATRTIRNKYFTNIVEGAEELSLRYNKQSDAFGFSINDIVEVGAVDAITNGIAEKGILIVRDINNNPKKGQIVSYETLLRLSEKYAPRISEAEIERLFK